MMRQVEAPAGETAMRFGEDEEEDEDEIIAKLRRWR